MLLNPYHTWLSLGASIIVDLHSPYLHVANINLCTVSNLLCSCTVGGVSQPLDLVVLRGVCVSDEMTEGYGSANSELFLNLQSLLVVC